MAGAAHPAVHQVKAVAKAALLVETLRAFVDRVDADHVLVDPRRGQARLGGVEQGGAQTAAALAGGHAQRGELGVARRRSTTRRRAGRRAPGRSRSGGRRGERPARTTRRRRGVPRRWPGGAATTARGARARPPSPGRGCGRSARATGARARRAARRRAARWSRPPRSQRPRPPRLRRPRSQRPRPPRLRRTPAALGPSALAPSVTSSPCFGPSVPAGVMSAPPGRCSWP